MPVRSNCAIHIHSHLLPSLHGKGPFGYIFGPLQQKTLRFITSKSRRDMTASLCATRVYYVLTGSGSFTIDDRRFDVRSGMLVEVPQNETYRHL
jgi:hypothetical protein